MNNKNICVSSPWCEEDRCSCEDYQNCELKLIKRNNKMRTLILSTLACIVLGFTIGTLLQNAIKKEAIMNCHNHEAFAKMYPGFYITQSQKDTCDLLGIEFSLPIKVIDSNK